MRAPDDGSEPIGPRAPQDKSEPLSERVPYTMSEKRETYRAMSFETIDASELRRGNKYGAKRTHSQLCDRVFDSRLEAERGEYLRMLEMAGEIQGLVYQPLWVLSEKPRVTYKADFMYFTHFDGDGEELIVEDVKGKMIRDSRTRIAWWQQLKCHKIRIVTKTPEGWQWRTL